MLKRIVVTGGLIVAFATVPMRAQTISRMSAAVWGGWVVSDGVDASTTVVAPDGNAYNRIDPKDGGVFGFNFGYNATEQFEVGFIYARQFSKLVVSGPTVERELGDLAVSTYHGYFAYNIGAGDARIRPFVLIGFGATDFGSVDATLGGVPHTIPGQTKFSTTWSAGANMFVSPHVGARAAIRWTPTYIKTDTGGWWCDPFWGCYLTGDPQYANQLEFSGGIVVRF